MSGTPVGLIAEGLLRDVLAGESGRASLRVSSSSMSPCLKQGDVISIAHVSPRKLIPGDIVVFRGEDGGLVVHRLIWRDRPLGWPTRVFTKGDASACLDRSVAIDRVLGRVETITRGEGRLRPASVRDRLGCLRLAASFGARRWARRVLGRSRERN